MRAVAVVLMLVAAASAQTITPVTDATTLYNAVKTVTPGNITELNTYKAKIGTCAAHQFAIQTTTGGVVCAALVSGDLPDLGAIYSVVGHTHAGVYEPVDSNILRATIGYTNPAWLHLSLTGGVLTGFGNSAGKDTGTGADNVAAGNHDHNGIYAALSHSHLISNITGLADALQAKQDVIIGAPPNWPIFGDAALKNTGQIAGTVAAGNDNRFGICAECALINHNHDSVYLGILATAAAANVADDAARAFSLAAQYIDWNSVSGGSSIANKPTLGNSSSRNVGTTAGTVAAGDDSRIVNAVQKDGDGNVTISPTVLGAFTVAAGDHQLPAAASASGKIYSVVDCESASACTTGGGSIPAFLRSDGAAWSLVGGAGEVCPVGAWNKGACEVKTVVPYTDSIFTAASTTADKTLFQLPATSLVKDWVIYPTTEFAGTGVTTDSVSIGCSTDAEFYAPSFGLLTAASTTVSSTAGGAATCDMAAHNVTARFTSNTNFGVGGVTVLTKGSVTIWVRYIPLS